MAELNAGPSRADKPNKEEVREMSLGHKASATISLVERRDALKTRTDLHRWVHDRLSLSPDVEQELFRAIDHVLAHYERAWQDSKDEALRAVASGSALRFNRMRDELSARDVTSTNVVRYFEQLVNDLTERTHRDDKTQLLNFRRFMEHVALSLTLERRAPWCALGVADITSFKHHNDTLGHAAGDRIIETVAQLLRREVRSSDRIAYQKQDLESASPLHARFGGDEFCFFLSNLAGASSARTVAERFWQAVAQHDWSAEDPRLGKIAVNVDIGLVCLRAGRVHERQIVASLAEELFARADKRLYAVKRGKGPYILSECVEVDDGRLVELDPSDNGDCAP
jgi:diguanylate cyclase (GGDEF)-like protein